jgi:similar to stage IV sporulation protein
MFSKLGRYYQGRVYIKAQGEGWVQFINEALKEGIVFFNGRKLPDSFIAEINARDFSPLRKAAKKAGIKLNIRAKYGFPFIALRWQRRKGLILGLFIIFLALTVLSQFVISVSVEGNERVSSAQIIAEAEKLGVKRWIPKKELELDRLSKQLQENIADLVWVSMEERGTNIRIRVVEKTLPPKVIYQGDLIAAKTGFVEDVIVIQGTAVIQEGEMVKKDQVLIKAAGGMIEYSIDMSGKTGTKENFVDAPAAKGFVRGRVWYSAEKPLLLDEELTGKTGSSVKGWGIKIKDRVIMITNQDSPYLEALQENKIYALPAWRNWHFPVEIIKVTYEEIQKKRIERTVSEARELAERQAREELKERIPGEAKILQDRVRIRTSEKGLEYVRVEVETFEELAIYRS